MMLLADISDLALKLAIKGGFFVLLFVVALLWYIWKNKRVVTSLKRAVDAENTAEFDALIRKHRKALSNEEHYAFSDVFDYLIERNSLACMRVLFNHDDALSWQRLYMKQLSVYGPLWETINFGSLDMLRLLLEQGMKAEEERVSPWLWAVSCGLVDAARLLDEFGASTISPAQQQADISLEDELLDVESWQNDHERFIATVDYLKERGYPLPVPILRRADEWRLSGS